MGEKNTKKAAKPAAVKKSAPKKSAVKKEEAKKPEPIFQTIQAPVAFKPDETAAMNIDLRGRLDLIEEIQAEAKEKAQGYKLQIASHTNHVKQLRLKLNAGKEEREVNTRVEFNAKTRKKKHFHAETGEFICELDMTPADFQHELFRPETLKKPDPTKPPENPPKANPNAKAPASSPAGSTNLGDLLDSTAAGGTAPKILLDITKTDWEAPALQKAAKAAMKKAAWTEVQISALTDRLKEANTVPDMIETLRPHCIDGTENAEQHTPAEAPL